METPDLATQIEQINDPEVLKSTLSALLDRIDGLEDRLKQLGGSVKKEPVSSKLIIQKQDRLEQIKHGSTELDERMQRPYVVSAELQAVKEVLDILAETGDCNSVILEGEPGTGKTQWAYSEVGQELQEGNNVSLIHIRVKDTMRAQDLLYSIDDVRRLSDAQAKAQVPEQIRQEAVAWKEKILNGDIDPATDKGYGIFRAKMDSVTELSETEKDLDYMNYVNLGPLGEAIYQSGKGKKVYLIIDEIEKGREELMTGILDEIENLTFTIGETGSAIKGDKKNLRTVITTNTEDSDKIPPSFRRRSLYHFIDYPSRNDMAEIVELYFPKIQKNLLDYAISVFYQYHENPDIQKKPSTPELLSWIRVLSKEFDGELPENIPHRAILLKYQEDQELEIGKINVGVQEEVERKGNELPHFVHKVLQGEPVFRVSNKLNSPHDQESLGEYYAQLLNKGVNFITPEFGEVWERNSYGDGEYVNRCTREFQVIVPGVDYLGDGYYVIPKDKMHLFDEVLDQKIEKLPAGQKFSSIDEKNSIFTKGRVIIDDKYLDAYMVEDGTVVVSKPYTNNG